MRGDDKTSHPELSLISRPLLRTGTACSFHQRQKICFVAMVNGECPHLYFLSKRTLLIYTTELSQRVRLYHSLGRTVAKIKSSLYKMMYSMHHFRWREHNLRLGTLPLFTDNQAYNTFSESPSCRLKPAPLIGNRKKLS